MPECERPPQQLFQHHARVLLDVGNLGKGLGFAQRIEEVARMLGGIDLTKESLAHAKKMVVTAKA